MLTIVVVVLGFTVENLHIDILAELGKFLPAFVITLLNDILKGLPAPLEFEPTIAGVAKIQIKFGADVPVSVGSKAVTSVPAGTIKPAPAHPGLPPVVPAVPPPPVAPAVPDTIPADSDIDPSLVNQLQNTPLNGLT